uniref:peptidylprolyl isomerase n=1 Tax=Amphora coffeiformis TaxID=265554 RepID=A0A6S8IXJ2_9STRA|mmetsp:Transcript_13326/g.25520  ORF Transcript_13326/g.25520 Transcript_13326/m.25520 type:complete len:229 (-) Transcript_13326:150-836(-)
MLARSLPLLVCCLVACSTSSLAVVAFTTQTTTKKKFPTQGITTGGRRGSSPPGTGARNLNVGFCLGPVARNGLAYEDVTIGSGRRILPGDTVYCYYQGSFTTKGQGLMAKATTTVFDEITEGAPLSIVIGKGDVIPGWDLGILGGLEGEIPPMNVGGKRRLLIPSGLAYGAQGAGPIPPNQDLEFELEVLQAGKESDISLKYRLGGYAVAIGIPVVILFAAYTVLNSI